MVSTRRETQSYSVLCLLSDQHHNVTSFAYPAKQDVIFPPRLLLFSTFHFTSYCVKMFSKDVAIAFLFLYELSPISGRDIATA